MALPSTNNEGFNAVRTHALIPKHMAIPQHLSGSFRATKTMQAAAARAAGVDQKVKKGNTNGSGYTSPPVLKFAPGTVGTDQLPPGGLPTGLPGGLPPGPNPFDPAAFLKAATAQAQGLIQPSLGLLNSQTTQGSDTINQMTQALLTALQPVPGQMQGIYQQGTNTQAALSAAIQQSMQNQGQDPTQAASQLLQSINAPASQQQQVTGQLNSAYQGGGAVLGGQGLLNASTLAGMGANAAGVAALMPQQVSAEGQDALGRFLSSQNTQAQSLLTQIPGLAQQIAQSSQSNALAQYNAQVDAMYKAGSLQQTQALNDSLIASRTAAANKPVIFGNSKSGYYAYNPATGKITRAADPALQAPGSPVGSDASGRSVWNPNTGKWVQVTKPVAKPLPLIHHGNAVSGYVDIDPNKGYKVVSRTPGTGKGFKEVGSDADGRYLLNLDTGEMTTIKDPLVKRQPYIKLGDSTSGYAIYDPNKNFKLVASTKGTGRPTTIFGSAKEGRFLWDPNTKTATKITDPLVSTTTPKFQKFHDDQGKWWSYDPTTGSAKPLSGPSGSLAKPLTAVQIDKELSLWKNGTQVKTYLADGKTPKVDKVTGAPIMQTVNQVSYTAAIKRMVAQGVDPKTAIERANLTWNPGEGTVNGQGGRPYEGGQAIRLATELMQHAKNQGDPVGRALAVAKASGLFPPSAIRTARASVYGASGAPINYLPTGGVGPSGNPGGGVNENVAAGQPKITGGDAALGLDPVTWPALVVKHLFGL